MTDGVDWLDGLPAGWEIKNLRHLGKVLLGLTYSPEDVCEENEGTLVIRASNIQNGQLVHADDVFVDRAIPANIINRKGDLVICSRNGSRRLIGKSAIVDDDWEGVTFGAFMTTVRTEYAQWMRWVLASSLFEFQSGRFMTSTINQLTISTLKSFPVPFPPIETQNRIAQFLDEKTAQIDGLIEKKQALLDRLAEKRQALITRAVTKGLNTDAPMKDSGIDWLGEIPAHWEVKQMRRLRDYMTSGSRGWAAYYADEGEPFLRMTNVTGWGTELDLRELRFVDLLGVTEGTRTAVQEGDVLITITAELGTVAIVRKEAEGAYINQHLALFRANKASCSPEFLVNYLTTKVAQVQFQLSGQGGTKQGLGFEQINSMIVGVPPVEEQILIGAYCKDIWINFLELERKLKLSIEQLAKYRSAIISSAVTGQLEGLQ